MNSTGVYIRRSSALIAAAVVCGVIERWDDRGKQERWASQVKLSTIVLCFCSGLACAQSVQLRTVALSGEQVPGLDPGVVYNDFGGVFRPVAINDAGDIAFVSRITGPGIGFNDNDIVLCTRASGSSIMLRARSGDPAPGFPAGVDYQFITGSGAQLDDQGAILFENRIVGTGVTDDNDFAYFTDLLGPTIAPIARDGDPAPGLPGLTWEPLTATLTGAGNVQVFAELTGPGVIEETNEAVFAFTAGTGFAPRVREGDPAPGFAPGVVIESIGNPAYNDAGGIAFEVTLAGPGITDDNSAVLYAASGFGAGAPGPAPIARAGEPVPGLPAGVIYDELLVFRPLLLTNAGDVAFVGEVTDSDVPPDRRQVFMVGIGGPNARPLAITEAQIPGQPQGTQIRAFLDAAYSDLGHAAFIALLEGSSVTPGIDDEALFVDTDGSGIRLIARRGEPAPGAPAGVVYESFGDAVAPTFGAAGSLIYTATLSGGRQAVYTLDAAGAPRLLVASGQTIDVNNNPNTTDLRQIDFLLESSVTRNNANQAALTLSFTDGTWGVFLARFIEPCAADFNNNGLVNILDVVGFVNNWNAQGPGADFNQDGSINILDVVAFIGVWNAGCP
jgi:hypothetical protein